MQPLTALIGIVMGSSIALLAGLSMTLVVFLMLPEYRDRLAGEFPALLQAIAWAVLLVASSVAAFLGQLKRLGWRVPAQAVLAAAILMVGWNYWP
jgi:hypothetical protein